MQTNAYKLRVDSHDLDQIGELVRRYTSCYLFCLENVGEENPHSHFYLELLPGAKVPAIRAFIRKWTGGGNGKYSMKAVEYRPIAYLAYCTKEGSYTTNLPTELIKEAIAYDERVKIELKEKKKSRRTVLQKIEDKYFLSGEMAETNGHSIRLRPDGSYWGQESIVHVVVDYYRSEGILVRQFMLVSLCQTLCLKYVPSYDYSFERKILDQL